MNHENYRAIYNNFSPAMKRFDDYGRETVNMLIKIYNDIDDPHLRIPAIKIIVGQRTEEGGKYVRKVCAQMSKKRAEWKFVDTVLKLFHKKLS